MKEENFEKLTIEEKVKKIEELLKERDFSSAVWLASKYLPENHEIWKKIAREMYNWLTKTKRE